MKRHPLFPEPPAVPEPVRPPTPPARPHAATAAPAARDRAAAIHVAPVCAASSRCVSILLTLVPNASPTSCLARSNADRATVWAAPVPVATLLAAGPARTAPAQGRHRPKARSGYLSPAPSTTHAASPPAPLPGCPRATAGTVAPTLDLASPSASPL